MLPMLRAARRVPLRELSSLGRDQCFARMPGLNDSSKAVRVSVEARRCQASCLKSCRPSTNCGLSFAAGPPPSPLSPPSPPASPPLSPPSPSLPPPPPESFLDVLSVGATVAIFLTAVFTVLAIGGCAYFPYANFYRGGKGDDIPGEVNRLDDDMDGY